MGFPCIQVLKQLGFFHFGLLFFLIFNIDSLVTLFLFSRYFTKFQNNVTLLIISIFSLRRFFDRWTQLQDPQHESIRERSDEGFQAREIRAMFANTRADICRSKL